MSGNTGANRRGFLKAAGGAAAGAALAGCAADTGGSGGGDGDETQTLTYARGGTSGTLDPQNTTSGEDVKVTNQLYDQLVMFKPGTPKLRAGLAKKYTLDGTTATLTLREGVTFHNGEEFTAADVVATYRRFVDTSYEHYPGEKYTSAYAAFTLGDWVKNVSTDGKYSVTMELQQRYAPFLRNLAMFAASVLSKKAIAEKGKKLQTQPVGTGPFAFENWDQGNQKIRLSKNADYWGQAPKVGEVVFTTIGSNTSRAQTLSSGGADVIDGIGAQASNIVANANNAELVEKKGINVGYMALNMANVKPFRNRKVRRAMNYAIDTKAIVETIFKGIAERASQPIPSNLMGYNDDLSPYPHDPEKAKRLMKEAGYGDGFSFELAVFKNPRTYNPSPQQAAQTVRSNLGEVGVDVSINKQSWNPFLDYTSSGKHDACFLGWMTDNADPDNFYYTLLHPGVSKQEIPSGQDWVGFDAEGFNTNNASAWANREFMTLVEDAQTVYDKGSRRQKYRQAGKISHEEAPWVFLDHAKELRGVGSSVKGFTLAPIGGPFLNRVSLS